MRGTHGIDGMRTDLWSCSPLVRVSWEPTSTQWVVSLRHGSSPSRSNGDLWNLPGLVVLTICGPFDFCRFYRSHLTPPAIFFGGRLDKLGVILALITSTTVTILINNDRRIETNVRQWVFPLQMLVCDGTAISNALNHWYTRLGGWMHRVLVGINSRLGHHSRRSSKARPSVI